MSRAVAFAFVFAVVAAGCTSSGALRYEDATWRDSGVAQGQGPGAVREEFEVPPGTRTLRVDLWFEADAEGFVILEDPVEGDAAYLEYHPGTKRTAEPWFKVDDPNPGAWLFGVVSEGRVEYAVGAYY